ncbi:MAG: WYL domain-containing protein [Synergistaceae bacterium]|jgi:predicted DNA-binding transcriptional regulator YafY|nr:WYL domain-containing protein [Synergistaceae bacterium]
MFGKEEKSFRLLSMYEILSKGGNLEKAKIASDFGVSPKTVQRDINDLRAFLTESHSDDGGPDIRYDKTSNSYSLMRSAREWLTREEALAIVKILLDSRAFPKEEIKTLSDKLIGQTLPDDSAVIRDIARNELFYYVQPRHGKNILPALWELSEMIRGRETAKFTYERQDGKRGEREARPVAVMFSEFYFYLVAYTADGSHDFPAVFRIDRIENIRGTGKKFSVPYEKKFSEGEFRKRVQFMYPGELQRVTFDFKGDSIEAVLDRLPTAEIVSEREGVYTVTAEVYGKGIDMWLRSQGDFVSGIKIREVRRK